MTKRELVDTLSQKTGLSKRQVNNFLKKFTDTVYEEVSEGNKVQITGFGVFYRGKRAARRGVDPRTQEEIQIPEMKMPAFRAGKRFKEAVRS